MTFKKKPDIVLEEIPGETDTENMIRTVAATAAVMLAELEGRGFGPSCFSLTVAGISETQATEGEAMVATTVLPEDMSADVGAKMLEYALQQFQAEAYADLGLEKIGAEEAVSIVNDMRAKMIADGTWNTEWDEAVGDWELEVGGTEFEADDADKSHMVNVNVTPQKKLH